MLECSECSNDFSNERFFGSMSFYVELTVKRKHADFHEKISG